MSRREKLRDAINEEAASTWVENAEEEVPDDMTTSEIQDEAVELLEESMYHVVVSTKRQHDDETSLIEVVNKSGASALAELADMVSDEPEALLCLAVRIVSD